jgi:hypothetical protein
LRNIDLMHEEYVTSFRLAYRKISIQQKIGTPVRVTLRD